MNKASDMMIVNSSCEIGKSMSRKSRSESGKNLESKGSFGFSFAIHDVQVAVGSMESYMGSQTTTDVSITTLSRRHRRDHGHRHTNLREQESPNICIIAHTFANRNCAACEDSWSCDDVTSIQRYPES